MVLTVDANSWLITDVISSGGRWIYSVIGGYELSYISKNWGRRVIFKGRSLITISWGPSDYVAMFKSPRFIFYTPVDGRSPILYGRIRDFCGLKARLFVLLNSVIICARDSGRVNLKRGRSSEDHYVVKEELFPESSSIHVPIVSPCPKRLCHG